MGWFSKKEDRYEKSYYSPVTERKNIPLIDREKEEVNRLNDLYINGNISAGEALKYMRGINNK